MSHSNAKNFETELLIFLCNKKKSEEDIKVGILRQFSVMDNHEKIMIRRGQFIIVTCELNF